MIARVWRGISTEHDADAYVAHLEEATFPKLRDLPGHIAAYVLRHTDQRSVEFLVITLWDSVESIQAFAGDDYERAVVPPEAQQLLVGYDDRAAHYDVPLVSP